jgi:hypothetical protein
MYPQTLFGCPSLAGFGCPPWHPAGSGARSRRKRGGATRICGASASGREQRTPREALRCKGSGKVTRVTTSPRTANKFCSAPTVVPTLPSSLRQSTFVGAKSFPASFTEGWVSG